MRADYGERTWRGRISLRVCVATLCLLALSSCSVHQASRPRRIGAFGCVIAKFGLRGVPEHVMPGQLIRLRANGPRGPEFIGLQSWGTFGRARGGRFLALYDIPTVLAQEQVRGLRDIRISSSPTALAGVALPNMPFVTRIPPVPAGTYLIQFNYSVSGLAQAELHKLGLGSNRLYTLCAPVRVSG
jgi:hypothetical protein